jgi:hypothetical protein
MLDDLRAIKSTEMKPITIVIDQTDRGGLLS